jgi:hypothetical protein
VFERWFLQDLDIGPTGQYRRCPCLTCVKHEGNPSAGQEIADPAGVLMAELHIDDCRRDVGITNQPGRLLGRWRRK